MRSLVGSGAEVRRVVPQHAGTHAHPRRNKIPQIPLSKQDAVTMELGQLCTASGRNHGGATDPARPVTIHLHVDSLEVSADQDRTGCRRRAREKAFGAPDKQIMADQKAARALFASRSSAVFALLERAHCAQGIGTDVPDNAWTVGAMETIADRVRTRVKQRLPAAVAMILDSVTAAAVLIGAIVDVAEPTAVLKRQAANPFALQLRERLDT